MPACQSVVRAIWRQIYPYLPSDLLLSCARMHPSDAKPTLTLLRREMKRWRARERHQLGDRNFPQYSSFLSPSFLPSFPHSAAAAEKARENSVCAAAAALPDGWMDGCQISGEPHRNCAILELRLQ